MPNSGNGPWRAPDRWTVALTVILVLIGLVGLLQVPEIRKFINSDSHPPPPSTQKRDDSSTSSIIESGKSSPPLSNKIGSDNKSDPDPPPSPAETSPKINSVSPILPTEKQTVVIRGSGFGQHDPYNGCTNFLMFEDISSGWHIGLREAFWGEGEGCPNGQWPIYVKYWADDEVVIGGFPGRFGVGDVVKITIANAKGIGIFNADKSLKGGAVGKYAIAVVDSATPSGGAAKIDQPLTSSLPPNGAVAETHGVGNRAPTITSVSPILPTGKQTVVIRGSGFGQHDPYNGCTNFLLVEDIAFNFHIGLREGFWGQGEGCPNGEWPLFVKSWADDEVAIGGFPGTFGVGDVIKITIANAQGVGIFNADKNLRGGAVGKYSLEVTNSK